MFGIEEFIVVFCIVEFIAVFCIVEFIVVFGIVEFIVVFVEISLIFFLCSDVKEKVYPGVFEIIIVLGFG